MPVIISIEGNIGSGKSSFVKYLKFLLKDEAVVVIPEPVQEWVKIRDSSGKTMISYFYEDQERNSFSFQMMAYISRLAGLKKAIEENPSAKVIITERCLQTDRNVFAKMLFHDKKIRDIDYQIYQKWFDTFAMDYTPNYYIYLRANAEVCSERIHKRARIGEEHIPIEYLEACGNSHDEWLTLRENTFVCDGSLSMKEGHPKWGNIVKTIVDSHSKDIAITDVPQLNYYI